jgi:hypothetical protein
LVLFQRITSWITNFKGLFTILEIHVHPFVGL